MFPPGLPTNQTSFLLFLKREPSIVLRTANSVVVRLGRPLLVARLELPSLIYTARRNCDSEAILNLTQEVWNRQISACMQEIHNGSTQFPRSTPRFILNRLRDGGCLRLQLLLTLRRVESRL